MNKEIQKRIKEYVERSDLALLMLNYELAEKYDLVFVRRGVYELKKKVIR